MSGVHLARIRGIDIVADWSVLIIIAIIVLGLGGGALPAWHPDWSPALRWGSAVAASLVFLLSILVHELSHAIVGRAQGMTVRRVTLFVFGGMAHLESEPPSWKAEFWMALVGPLVSAAIGIGLLLAAGPQLDPELLARDPEAAYRALGPVASLALWLGSLNLLLAGFNLVPGYPLDGGRVLRAVLWRATGSLRRATELASGAGRVFAWILIGAGVAMMLGLRVPVLGTGVAGGLWVALIGWFLHSAAIAGVRQAQLREALSDVPLVQAMHRARTVDPALSLRELADDYFLRHDQRAYPVASETGALVGLVGLRDVRKVERGAWDTTRVDAVMTPHEDLLVLSPDDDLALAAQRLAERSVNQIPVVRDGRVEGMITREDILRWMTLRGEAGEEGIKP